MGKCKVLQTWFSQKDHSGRIVSEWALKKSDHEVMCLICNCSIVIKSCGFQGLYQHSNTEKHQREARTKLHPMQLKMVISSEIATEVSTNINKMTKSEQSESTSILMYAINDRAVVAELIWTLKSIASDYSFSSCDHVKSVFDTMFPNSVPQHFSLSQKKMRYLVTDALAPFFKGELIDEFSQSRTFYSIIYDETTNSTGAKELQVLIRFYSNKYSAIITRHLETFFIGTATAEVILEKICTAVDNANIPYCNMLMLGSDGPNVNKKVFIHFHFNIHFYNFIIYNNLF